MNVKQVPQNMLSQLVEMVAGNNQSLDAVSVKGGTPWLDQNIQYSVKSLMVKLL